MKYSLLFLLSLTFLACDNSNLESKITDLEAKLETAEAALAEAEQTLADKPGLIHSVFFWLKEDLSEADEAAFIAGVESLKTIRSIKSCYIGPPAPTEERGVVDNSYSYALIVHFEDVTGQDAYQVDPIHLKFVEDHQDKWTKVVVYDNLITN
jgi:hypothetical protein